MMFTGLWTTRYLEKDLGQDNYVIITTDASPLAARVRDRMPVILSEAQAQAWLGPEYKKLESFLVPYKGRNFTAYQVGDFVNKVKNIDKRCIVPIATT